MTYVDAAKRRRPLEAARTARTLIISDKEKPMKIALFAPRHPRTSRIAAAGLSCVIIPAAIYAISETGRWLDAHMKSACEKAARRAIEALPPEEEAPQARPADSLARKAGRAGRACLRSFTPVTVAVAYTAGSLILMKGTEETVGVVRRAEKKALREIRRWNRPYPFNRLPA